MSNRFASHFVRLLTAGGAVLSLSACQEAAVPVAHADDATAGDAVADAAEAPARTTPRSNQAWWPETVDLSPLRKGSVPNPYGDDFDYAAEFLKLDLKAVKTDLAAVLTDSKDWWPADYGTYGGFFVRLAWHSAGTYRVIDGRGGSDGGQIRFEPLNSWPDNTNLDKARRLLHPVKMKYGNSISWADLMILAGNVAMEEAGFETLGFAGGRVDDWEPDLVYWGPENEFLADQRYHGERELENPLAAVQMGLIYVNPEGPNGNPDPLAAAHDIRDTFGRMAMNDVETVALIAGGHSFGKAHGAHSPKDCVAVEPAGASVEKQGTGWHNKCGAGNGADTVTSGLEGAWTQTPDRWSHLYFTNLMSVSWEKTKSPAGATQWKPEGDMLANSVPDAHDSEKRHQPVMFTTDMSLKKDPEYAKLSKRFQENPAEFEAEFAKAWFKLTHRDLGPKSRYLGPEIPEETFSWQDPIPAVDFTVVDAADVSTLKAAIQATGLSASDLASAAWASASSYRGSDMRGGANGARVRLAPQASWAVNSPDRLGATLQQLEAVQQKFNKKAKGGKKVALADVIVLAGAVGVEQAASAAGGAANVSFAPGRNDATAEQTDATSFGYLEPKADGFRNYYADGAYLRPSDALIDKAALLGLTPSEMTALVGGLRVLDMNAGGSKHGVFTDKPGSLSNDFFINLLDQSTSWSPKGDGTFEGKGPDGTVRWTATEVDLVFGSNSELRAICEVYSYDQDKFQADFAKAWTKVMQADRFDLHR
ncbi:MAG TPA: catalase/peroxidase HPI [Deltaproteobacteria bacterium]|nr:catalase/peroxidase HPI [Deltaproteobacteria bacterium]